MSTGAPTDIEDKSGCSKEKLEERERERQSIREFATLWMMDTWFSRLAVIDTMNLWESTLFKDRLNGRDRHPDLVQGEVHVFAEPIAGDEVRHMVVDAGADCAVKQESRGL